MARTLQPGDALGGYRILTLLGRGGMATVYLAEHDRLKRKVALKVLSPELAADESFRQRFSAESERLASVDHPNIIPVYEAGEEDSLLFIAMRYVETTDLKHLIAHEGSLDPDRALSIVTQMAGALDAAHAKGLVHRDVKPANVLVAVGVGPDASDHAYLSDFGLTKRTEETSGLTRTGYFLGTIDYCAPEQITGKGIDGRTDQYALACVLFESLTGKPPFDRDDDGAVLFAHLSQPPPPVTAIRPELPTEIDDVIRTAMAKNKEDRYPYCVAFARSARGAILGSREVTPPAGITSDENRMVAAIGTLHEAEILDETIAAAAPVRPAVEMPAPPPAAPTSLAPTLPPAEPAPAAAVSTPAPTGPAPTATPTQEPPPDKRGLRRLLVPIAAVAVLGLAGLGAFLLFSGDDEQIAAGPTGDAATTGTTGATGGTGATAGTPGAPPLSEAKTFGTWKLTFSPEGDTSTGSATNSMWELAENCANRTGSHPCDVDAVRPVSGFLQRLGKDYEGTVTGELPCGSNDTMRVSFEVLRADLIDGVWRAVEIGGAGTMLSGVCNGSVFTLVGTLP